MSPSAAKASAIRVGLSTRRLNRHGDGPVEGIAVYTRALLDQLRMRDDVIAKSIAGFGPSDRSLVAPGSEELVLPFPYGPAAALSVVTGRPFAGSRGLSRTIDLYHATDYWIPKLSVPVVATLHDAIPLSHPHWGAPRHRRLKNSLLRSSARWADAIITVSQAMVDPIVEHFGIRRERIHVVYNGVADEWFDPLPAATVDAALSARRLARGYFLAVGTLQPRKNLERLLEAHRTLPLAARRHHPLVIVGREGWGIDRLKTELDREHALATAVWLSDVDESELRAIFAGAHALSYPSLYEGFGLPMVEAFASGVPVIASTVSAMPEIAAGAALLVDPESVADIADAMLRLVDDAALAARLASAGRSRALDFSWRGCASGTLQVYRRALGG